MVKEVILQEKVICYYIPVTHSPQLSKNNIEKCQNVISCTQYICKNFLMERKKTKAKINIYKIL